MDKGDEHSAWCLFVACGRGGYSLCFGHSAVNAAVGAGRTSWTQSSHTPAKKLSEKLRQDSTFLKNKPATTFAGGVYRRSESSSRRTAPTWFGITDAFSPADKLPERYLQSAALPTTI
jgi:hypothetical protein